MRFWRVDVLIVLHNSLAEKCALDFYSEYHTVQFVRRKLVKLDK
jgi:hypothetical protein